MSFTSYTYGDPAIVHPTLISGSPIGLTGPVFPQSGNSPHPVAVDLKGGVNGTAYSETISAVGGGGGYAFAVQSGSLPTGTSLNSSTGVISGTPTVTATFSFVIRVTDPGGNFGDQAFNIIVSAAAAGGGGNFGWIN